MIVQQMHVFLPLISSRSVTLANLHGMKQKEILTHTRSWPVLFPVLQAGGKCYFLPEVCLKGPQASCLGKMVLWTCLALLGWQVKGPNTSSTTPPL